LNKASDKKASTARLFIPSNEVAIELYGPREAYLKRLESIYGVKLTARGNELVVSGGQDVVDRVYSILEALLATSSEKGGLHPGYPRK